jgi:hypothetical protein
LPKDSLFGIGGETFRQLGQRSIFHQLLEVAVDAFDHFASSCRQ